MAGLHDLEVLVVGSADLTRATESVCRTVPGDAAGRSAEQAPDLLLAEGVEELSAERRGELEELLARCRRESVPSALWITANPFDPAFLALAPRFTRVFSTDRDHLPPLREAGCVDAALLWPGTALPLPPAKTPAATAHSHRDVVIWLGGWRAEWPAEWRRKLLAIIDAAQTYGLRIAEPEDRAALAEARVAIAADPDFAAPHMCPAVVFDAIASGAVAITPHRFATIWDFSVGRPGDDSWRSLIPVAEDRETAEAELDRLLADDGLFDETVETSMRIVRNNHTHAHRIARLATLAGVHAIPDAAADPARR